MAIMWQGIRLALVVQVAVSDHLPGVHDVLSLFRKHAATDMRCVLLRRAPSYAVMPSVYRSVCLWSGTWQC